MNHHRDGKMRHKITPGKINYWPNRNGIVPPATAQEGSYIDYPEKIVAMKQRLNSAKFGEHYTQAQMFYNSMSPVEKEHIASALSFELDHCDDTVVYGRMVERLCDVDLSLAQTVATKVGVPSPTKAGRPNPGLKAKGMSQRDFTPAALGLPPTIVSRNVAILIMDGFNFTEYEAVKVALTAAGAFVFTIGPRRTNIIPASGGKGVAPQHNFEAMRSTAFDTIYIPGGEHVNAFRKNGRALHWIREAFGHLKAIGATGEAVQLVREAANVEGMVYASGAEVVDSYGVVTAGGIGEGAVSIREGIQMMKEAKNFIDKYAFEISQHRNYERELAGLSAMVAY
jgi:catalase